MGLTAADRGWLGAQRLPLALVFNAHINGLGVARSLHRRGVPVALPAPARDLATQRCGRWLRSPPFDSDEFMEFLHEVGGALPLRGVLFPLTDALVVRCIAARDSLSRYWELPLPSPAALEAAGDKRALLATARRAGVATPPSWTGGALPAGFTFPALLKPTAREPDFKARFGHGRLRLDDRATLERRSAELARYAPLAQSLVPGPEAELWTFGAACREGVVLAGFTGRKLLQFPPGVGTGAVAQAQPANDVAAAGRKLLRAVRYTGVAQVEFKRDPHGELRLLEINPRPWAWNELAADCGVNLPLALYCAALGKRLRTRQALPGRKWRHGRLWLLATLRTLLRGGDWRAALRAGLGAHGVCAHGDFGPLRTYLPMALRTLPGELRLHLQRR